ncbi:ABC transporter permease [Endomicrobium proavitum]|uniref:Putative Lipoprotein-releasing system transmembrane protein LolC n=1 Tax=Endomicrobium proavitum TaxID=1408281 RepID=A0A0G3WIW9_9BACT|nr:ABC transporter permease [Endomicrobium proavitum]AKL97822.1 putative Lipoprotein-releasing system transmembrane protein LolC [Endomicrobium proavitum]
MSVETFIAFRYLKARKKGFFSLLTTLIAVGGTTLGVAALVITLAIMSGFQNDIRNKILGIQPHIIVNRIDGAAFTNYAALEDVIKENKNVVSFSPFIYVNGIIRSQNSPASTGIVIKAVDFACEDKMVNLSKQISVSDLSFDKKNIGARNIIIGNEMAKQISATAGDEVILMFPSGLTSVPKMYKFNVAAVIHSGMYEFDSYLAFMDLNEAQKMFNMQGEVSGISVHTKNFDKAVSTAHAIEKEISFPYRAKAWIEMNKNLFSALKLEKIMMFLVLGLIILVAAFNIISNLLLLSAQKSKEIGIMSAMGFSKKSIAKIFFYEGLIVGFIGTVLGLFFGVCVSLILKYFEIFKLPQGVYYVDRLPVAIIPSDILLIAASAFLITVLAGLYPAYQVSKLDPLEAIRYG